MCGAEIRMETYVANRSLRSTFLRMPPISAYELENKRREVRDLRAHYARERQRFSRTVLDLINYCQQNLPSDPLVCKVKDNPFNEKKWICGMF